MPNVSLTPVMEREIEEAIAAGEYTSASEIVREGLRLWKERRTKALLYDEWLRAQIELGWDQAERGEVEEHNMQAIIDDVIAKSAP
ncbi:MAG: type II toxin-antitoxin system ParD family antitoxin [Deltaproteobacteria bacterium]|nr:type II toxin-antitoxin system ParD family antitoxin [Deltaproteobacteria bacterium]